MHLASSPDRPAAREIVAQLAGLGDAEDQEQYAAVRDAALTRDTGEIAAFVGRDDYHFVRGASFSERAAVKDLLRNLVNRTFPDFAAQPQLQSNTFGASELEEFRAKGIAAFGQYIAASECAEILAYLSKHPVYNAHIAACSDRIPRRIGDPQDPAEAYQFGAYAEHVIAKVPHVAKLATNSALLRFLKSYFGVTSVLRDVHLWWSFPAPDRFGPQPYAGQGFHRDFRSLQDIQFFVCLTDLPDDDGAHEYFAGTHDEGVFARQMRQHPALKDLPESEVMRRVFFPPVDGYGTQPGDETFDRAWSEILGDCLVRVPIRAGDCFMIDTMGLHRGVPPKRARRLMFSARFTAAGAEVALGKQAESAPAAREELTEHAYTLSAFRQKLGDVLDAQWFDNDSRIEPQNEGPREPKTEVSALLSALEQAVLDRTQRIASLETTAEGCVRRLLELERTLSERKRDIASLETTIEERSVRLSALEDALDERTRRIAKLEVWRRAASAVRDRLWRRPGRAA
jgi:Phytanoyl-CoA dioxygenase (PhyH)